MSNKRLFFSCPIKAAYMAKYFNIELETRGNLLYLGQPQFWPVNSEIMLRDQDQPPFYVCKESEKIFERKEGDESQGNTFDEAKNKWCGHRQHKAEDYEIEKRDNKHFFMPEVEDAK